MNKITECPALFPQIYNLTKDVYFFLDIIKLFNFESYFFFSKDSNEFGDIREVRGLLFVGSFVYLLFFGTGIERTALC